MWTFGIFFVLFTTQCAPLGIQNTSLKDHFKASSPEQVLNWAEQENQRNPQDPKPYLIRAQAAFELAQSARSASDRRAWYSEMRLSIDEFDLRSESVSSRYNADRDSLLVRAWQYEFTRAEAILFEKESFESSYQASLEIAIPHLENAYLILPDSVKSREWLATLYYDKNDVIRALTLLEEGQSSPAFLPISYQEKLAWLYLETGNLEAALSVYENLSLQEKTTKRLRVAQVNALLLAGDKSQGIERLASLAQDYPNDPDFKKALLLESLRTLEDLISTERVLTPEIDDVESLFSESSQLVEQISNVGSHPAIWWLSGAPTNNFSKMSSSHNSYTAASQQYDHLGFIREVSSLFIRVLQKLEQAEQLAPEIHRITIKKQLFALQNSVLPFLERWVESEPDSSEIVNILLHLYTELGLSKEAEAFQKRMN